MSGPYGAAAAFAGVDACIDPRADAGILPVTAPRHIVASSASISAFVARPRLNAVALPQAVPRRRAAS